MKRINSCWALPKWNFSNFMNVSSDFFKPHIYKCTFSRLCVAKEQKTCSLTGFVGPKFSIFTSNSKKNIKQSKNVETVWSTSIFGWRAHNETKLRPIFRNHIRMKKLLSGYSSFNTVLFYAPVVPIQSIILIWIKRCRNIHGTIANSFQAGGYLQRTCWYTI